MRTPSEEFVLSRSDAVGAGNGETPRAFHYWLLFKERWRLVAAVTLALAVPMLIWAKFIATPVYRASVLLKPSGKQGLLSTLLAQSPIELPVDLGEDSGGGRGDALEYKNILNGYTFTVALIRKYPVIARVALPKPGWLNLFIPFHKPTEWGMYKTISHRFDCEYDAYQQTLLLSFDDPNPKTALQIISLYVDSFREQLRNRDIQRAQIAAETLLREAHRTADVMLQSQLYAMAADQVRREKMAQVEADYSLKVLDGPVVPDRPYEPRPLLDAITAAIIGFVLATLWVAVVRPVRVSYREFEIAMASNHRESNGLPVAGSVQVSSQPDTE